MKSHQGRLLEIAMNKIRAPRALRKPQRATSVNRQLAFILSVILAVFVVDITIPLGVAVWVLYLLPVWLASRYADSRSWLVPLTVVLCTASNALGFLHSPPGLAPPIPIINRLLALTTLWVVALLLLRSVSVRSALAEQTAVLQQQAELLDAANVMIREPNGRILAWSHGMERLFDYKKEEALGEIAQRLLKTQFGEPLTAIETQLESSGEWHGELLHARRDGSPVFVASHWVLQRDEQHRPVAVLEVTNDITQVKRAEGARRESDERFRVMADTIPDIIFTNRADGWSDFNNQRFYDYTGLPQGAGAGQGWTAAVHPDDLERTKARWRESMRTGMPYETEFRLRGKDGGYRWFVGRARPIRDEHGQITKWFGTCTDIHDLKQADEEVRRLLRQAEAREKELREKQAQLVQAAKLASLGELVSGIAHELNNPLNNISLFLGNAVDRIQNGKLEADDLLTSVVRAVQQTERAAMIIKHLRTFARTASTEHEPVSLNDVVLSALSLVQEQLRLREIDVRLKLSPEEPIVLGSRIQLEQVLLNLVSNARDAVATAPEKQIAITSAVGSDFAEVRVTDTGVGISADILPHIFDPFFTTKAVGEGTGLGLSISYGIIEDHQGRVSVESADPQGTTFIIALPLAAVRVNERATA
jgi:PAS domain S-box-containing protein